MTEQNKAVEALEAAASALPVLATLLGHAKLEQGQQRANETLKLVQAALSRPTQTADAVEALDMARQLVQEAKSVDGPSGGYVTDHLDAAEGWLDKLEAALSHTATSEVEPVYTLTLEIDGDSQTDLMIRGEAAYMDALKIIRDDGRAEVISIVEKTPQIETGDIPELITEVLAEIAEARLEAVQRSPTPTPDSGLAGELRETISSIIFAAWDSGQKGGWPGSDAVADQILTALQSNSDSELLRKNHELSAQLSRVRDAINYSGATTDSQLDDMVKVDRDRLSLREMAKKFGVGVGRIRGSLARLEQGAA